MASQAIAANPPLDVPIEAETVKTQLIREFEFSQGTIKSMRREYLVFQSSGRVDFVKSGASGRTLLEGDIVKEGELLAELGYRQNAASVKSAKAHLENVRAHLRNTKNEYDRAKRLIDSKAISSSRLEQIKTSYEQALSAVRVQEATLDQTQAELSESQLRAPFDGQVAFVNIHEGQYYSQQQFDPSSAESATLTAPLVIIDPTSFEVIVEIPIFSGNRVKAGQDAFLLGQESLTQLRLKQFGTIDSINDFMSPAQVLAVSPAVNPKDRSIRVRLSADQATELKLIDGDFVTALIEVGHKNDATVIPMNALIARGSKYFVYIINDNSRTERREIAIGLFGLNSIEVVSGLKLGDKVVTKGKNRVKQGSTVRIVNGNDKAKEGGSHE